MSTLIAMTDDELRDAIDGLMAHDVGSLQSGISDQTLRERVRAELAARSTKDIERLVAPMCAGEGHGVEDRADLREWLNDEMGTSLGLSCNDVHPQTDVYHDEGH